MNYRRYVLEESTFTVVAYYPMGGTSPNSNLASTTIADGTFTAE